MTGTDKPTGEQIKWLWEQCADSWESFNKDKHRHYRFGNVLIEDESPIDLNNLIEYSESVLDEKGEWYITFEKKWYDPTVKYVTINFMSGTLAGNEYGGEDNTFKDALFEALHKALGGKE